MTSKNNILAFKVVFYSLNETEYKQIPFHFLALKFYFHDSILCERKVVFPVKTLSSKHAWKTRAKVRLYIAAATENSSQACFPRYFNHVGLEASLEGVSSLEASLEGVSSLAASLESVSSLEASMEGV